MRERKRKAPYSLKCRGLHGHFLLLVDQGSRLRRRHTLGLGLRQPRAGLECAALIVASPLPLLSHLAASVLPIPALPFSLFSARNPATRTVARIRSCSLQNRNFIAPNVTTRTSGSLLDQTSRSRNILPTPQALATCAVVYSVVIIIIVISTTLECNRIFTADYRAASSAR